jgi:hypothetical protein
VGSTLLLTLLASSTLSLDLFMPETALDASPLVFFFALQTEFTPAGLFLLPLVALLRMLSARFSSLSLTFLVLGFLFLFLLGSLSR